MEHQYIYCMSMRSAQDKCMRFMQETTGPLLSFHSATVKLPHHQTPRAAMVVCLSSGEPIRTFVVGSAPSEDEQQ